MYYNADAAPLSSTPNTAVSDGKTRVCSTVGYLVCWRRRALLRDGGADWLAKNANWLARNYISFCGDTFPNLPVVTGSGTSSGAVLGLGSRLSPFFIRQVPRPADRPKGHDSQGSLPGPRGPSCLRPFGARSFGAKIPPHRLPAPVAPQITGGIHGSPPPFRRLVLLPPRDDAHISHRSLQEFSVAQKSNAACCLRRWASFQTHGSGKGVMTRRVRSERHPKADASERYNVFRPWDPWRSRA